MQIDQGLAALIGAGVAVLTNLGVELLRTRGSREAAAVTQRHEALRMIRWACELAASPHEDRQLAGVRALRALMAAELVTEREDRELASALLRSITGPAISRRGGLPWCWPYRTGRWHAMSDAAVTQVEVEAAQLQVDIMRSLGETPEPALLELAAMTPGAALAPAEGSTAAVKESDDRVVLPDGGRKVVAPVRAGLPRAASQVVRRSSSGQWFPPGARRKKRSEIQPGGRPSAG